MPGKAKSSAHLGVGEGVPQVFSATKRERVKHGGSSREEHPRIQGRGPGRAAERWTWTAFVVISAMVGLRH